MQSTSRECSSRAPIGYLNDKNTKTIIKDPERFPIVKRMWDLFLTGTHSAQSILEIASNEWGLRQVTKTQAGGGLFSYAGIYNMLRNPFYYGAIVSNGEYYKGVHEPMITQEQFNKARQLLARRTQQRPKRLNFTYTGLFTCGECGASITAERKQKFIKSIGKIRSYTYYHCTGRKRNVHCTQRAIDETNLESQVYTFLGSLTVSTALLQWIMHTLDSLEQDEVGEQKAVASALQNRINAIERERTELLNLRLREMLNDTEFISKKNQLEQEGMSLQSRLNATMRGNHGTLEACQATFQLCQHVQEIFMNESPKRKRELLAQIGSNRQLLNGKLLITAKKQFQIIQELVSISQRAMPRLEPSNLSEHKVQTATLVDISFPELHLVNEVRKICRENPQECRIFPELSTDT